MTVNQTIAIDGGSGGLVLCDSGFPATLADYDDFLDTLEIVLDPEGESDPACDDNESWREVENRAASDLRQMCANQQFALVLCPPSFPYSVRITSEELTAAEQMSVAATFTEYLHLPGGSLIVRDALDMFGFAQGFSDISKEQAIPVPPGWYTLHLYHLRSHPDASTTVGIWDVLAWPLLVVRLAPQKTSPKKRKAGAFPRIKEYGDELKLAPGKVCCARIRKFEGEIVTMQLMVTPTSSSGYGRMPIPPGVALKPGEMIRVRLLEDRRNFWRVEWIGKEGTR